MDGNYVTIQDYSGNADTANLIPLVGTSFKGVYELKEIVQLLKNWQYNTALKELDRLIAVDRQLMDSLLLKGEILSLFDCNHEAIEVFEKIIEIDPDNVYALIMRLIQLVISRGNESKIASSFNTLNQIVPEIHDYFKDVLDFINDNKLRFDYDPKDTQLDLICVFGYFLNDDGSLPVKLEQRLNKVRKLAKNYPDATVLISGGAVQNQYCEAVEMKKHLCDAGIEEERLVSLERARDTVGNIIEFMGYIKSRKYSNICVVTSLEHLPRAWMSLCMGLTSHNYNAQLFGAATEETISNMEKEIRLSYQTVFRIAGLFEKQDIAKLLKN